MGVLGVLEGGAEHVALGDGGADCGAEALAGDDDAGGRDVEGWGGEEVEEGHAVGD